ncbi:TIGR00366 family protein [Vibrio sp. SS-MA-C1-2]|uniref:YfcC family protein n=1 Tax=Vibrio sp. SS-MA-C1-2 TaxID=2908646 RepID=UPI001F1ACFD9|nr:TIGR00366 family protein [Vibrio sp. SS-MA-C1-2]UJF17824.1 TIGR00366 family protein [Vibrio sp. SS-MA-C1-2]
MQQDTTVHIKAPVKKEFPDIYLILIGMLLISAVLSYLIPAGEFSRITLENGRQTVVAGSYTVTENSPVDLMQIVTAIPRGLSEASSVVFLTLLVGGSIGVLQRIGVISFGINTLINKIQGSEYLAIPILMVIFSAICAFVGTPELGIAYIPIVIPLMAKLGYDKMTGVALVLISCTFGFAFGITSPTNVGLGHMLAELPMFSGALFRFATLTIVMSIAIYYILNYAKNNRVTPIASPDIVIEEISSRLFYSSIITLFVFVAIIASTIIFGLGFYELSGLFVCMSILAAAIAGIKPNEICNKFNLSFQDMLTGALITGVARAVSVVLVDGNVLDTIVHHLSIALATLPSSMVSIGILFTQAVFNFLVPSGSGQTLLTMPILIPLADLLGITRQTIVLATQWGDGITNILFPTSGYFMAILVMAKVNYINWVKFFLPLLVTVTVLSAGFLVIAQMIEIGPF